jgi:hypothetical protein
LSRKIISWWKYNPLLQKPTSLDPVRPWGWYWYYGPDPASGCSYGQYHDDDYDFDMITAKESVVYSPATGKPMQYIGIVPEDEVKKKDTEVTGDQFARCHTTCTSCQANLISDYDLSELDKVHCVKCGNVCKVSIEDKKIKGAKTMTKMSSDQKIQTLKRRIRANILKKRKIEASKERRMKLEEERKKRLLASRTLKNQKIKAEEEEKANKEDDEELISLDTIMEAMDEEGGMEEALDEEATGADEEMDLGEEEMDLGEEEDLGAVEEDMGAVEEDMGAMEEDMGAVEEDMGAMEEDLGEEEMDLGSEEDLGEESEEGGEDEYYDLDMVLSMVNKKEALAKKNKPSKKKVKAEEEKKDEECEDDEVCEADDEKANDADEKDKEVEKDFALMGEEEEEKEKEKEEEAPAPKEDLEAMKFEPLASLDSLKKVRKEDIDIALYNEDSDNPTWNITVAGVPTAKVELRKQAAPDEIKAVFCSEDYAKDLIVHCEKTGFIQTMNKVKAEFWANHTSNKRIAERFTKEAKASFDIDRKRLLASFKQDFRNCINIVSAGMSKNFYPDMGNSLKEHLFTNLRTVGLPEQTAISVVEKSFAEGSASYFDSLFEKSEEYMNLTSDARKEIAAAISHGASLEHKLEDQEPATLIERVTQASLVANTVSGSPLKVTRDVVLDSNEYKNQLRSVWRNR